MSICHNAVPRGHTRASSEHANMGNGSNVAMLAQCTVVICPHRSQTFSVLCLSSNGVREDPHGSMARQLVCCDYCLLY